MNENTFSLIMFFLLAILLTVGAAGGILYIRTRNLSWGIVKPYLARRNITVRVWSIAAALLYAGMLVLGFHQTSNSYAKATLSLNFAEASKGQNANGTRYNMSEIICDQVLERAIEMGALEGVTVPDLRRCLDVLPLMQGGVGSEEEYHISTEFNLVYRANEKTRHFNAQNVVQLIIAAYREFYIAQYAENLQVLNMDITPAEDFAKLDYLDIQMNLMMQAQTIENYMYCLADKYPSFVSASGETFYSVAQKAAQLSENQIENGLYSLILFDGLSKDPLGYVERLNYENTMLGYDNQKASASFRVRNQAVSMYSEEMTRIVLVPTTDAAGEFYMGRTKVGIDELAMEAQSYSTQAAEYLKQIETNTAVINALQNGAGASAQGADVLIGQICNGLETLSQTAKRLAQEYTWTRMNQCVSAAVFSESFIQKAAVCVLLSLLFFCALTLLNLVRRIPNRRKSQVLPEEAGDGQTEPGVEAETQSEVTV